VSAPSCCSTTRTIGGIVVGTGDLSELALGWCTFNGDHMANYNVNASVPEDDDRVPGALVRASPLAQQSR
jgi:hypothetical protein